MIKFSSGSVKHLAVGCGANPQTGYCFGTLDGAVIFTYRFSSQEKAESFVSQMKVQLFIEKIKGRFEISAPESLGHYVVQARLIKETE